jgi:hypothetical protein
VCGLPKPILIGCFNEILESDPLHFKRNGEEPVHGYDCFKKVYGIKNATSSSTKLTTPKKKMLNRQIPFFASKVPKPKSEISLFHPQILNRTYMSSPVPTPATLRGGFFNQHLLYCWI